MNENYSLQLRHGAKTYSTRDAALLEIKNMIQYNISSIKEYEPILFYYGEEGAVNTLILVGLPDGQTNNGNSYFVVDTAELKDEISGIDNKIDEAVKELKEADEKLSESILNEAKVREEKDEELEEAINKEVEARENADKEISKIVDFNKENIQSVIDACGLIYNEKLQEDRVSYRPDNHDEILRDAENISDAISKISKFVIDLAKETKFETVDTDTVSLKIDNSDNGGKTLSAEVNIAGTEGLSKKNYDNNIIGKTKEGLYASVSVESNPKKPNILIFKTSGYIDGSFKVDAFETEVELPVYNGNNGKNSGITVTVDGDKNEIAATLNLASDSSNILKLEDGEYIVEGLAKNIKYGDTTVAGALKTQSNRISNIEDSIENVKGVDINTYDTDTFAAVIEKSAKGDFTVGGNVKLSNDKSIIVSNGGLKANINATFRKSTSVLTISVGNNDIDVDLSSMGVSVLNDAHYDSANESLVLIFEVNNREQKVTIPLRSLIHDLSVNNGNTIDLYLESVSGGPNVLTAEVRVDRSKSDNILTSSFNGLYVSKSHINDAVNEESNLRKEADSKLEKRLENVEKLSDSVKNNENSIKILDEKVSSIKNVEKDLSDEITRATEKEANLSKEIDKVAKDLSNEAIRSEAISVAIDTEKNRAMTAEAELSSKIEINTNKVKDIDAVKTDVSNEVIRAKSEEEKLAISIDAEKNRAMTAEAEIANNKAAIESEVSRAITSETELNSKVSNIVTDLSNEVLRAQSAEKANESAIGIINEKIVDIYTNKASINTLTSELSQEIIRAKSAEEANAKSIVTEKERAEHIESDLLEKISKNANDIVLLNDGVNSIELRKDGDLEYSLYVNGSNRGSLSIPQDQFLKEVTYDSTNKELVFVFNTSNGDTTTKIGIADLVSTYAAGDGLVQNSNVFSVDYSKVSSKENVTSLVEKESVRAQLKEEAIQNALNSEENRATRVEGDLASKISENSSEITILVEKTDKANFDIIKNANDINANSLAIENEIARAESNENILKDSIEKKANISDVFTKLEVNEKLSQYTKTEVINERLDEKVNKVEAELTYATNEQLSKIESLSAKKADVETSDNALSERITSNTEALNKINLVYNPATSTLTYTNVNGVSNEIKLYSGSLIKGGRFDSVGNNIILDYEQAGQTMSIVIPVETLISEINSQIVENKEKIDELLVNVDKLSKKWVVNTTNTVTLTKNTVGDEDVLSADVRISSAGNKQAIKVDGDGLFVSNELVDYTCVFGSEGTISGQDAISKLVGKTDDLEVSVNNLENRVETNENNISTLTDKVNTNSSSIETLKEKTSTLETKVIELSGKVESFETRFETFKTEIKSEIQTIKDGIDTFKTEFTKTIETKLETLKSEIVKEIVGEGNNLPSIAEINEELEAIKDATGYVSYNNNKTMSERLDNIETYIDPTNPNGIKTELDDIKDEIGDKNNPNEGTVWGELQKVVDAGTF